MAFWSKNPEFMPPIVFWEQEKGINFRGTGEQRPNLDGDRGTKKILVNREHKKTIFRFFGLQGNKQIYFRGTKEKVPTPTYTHHHHRSTTPGEGVSIGLFCAPLRLLRPIPVIPAKIHFRFRYFDNRRENKVQSGRRVYSNLSFNSAI